MQQSAFALACFLCSTFTLATPSLADSLTILNSNGDVIAEYDAAQLASMKNDTIKTTTPWTDSVDRYEGVSLQAVLNDAAAEGDSYTAIALNDYAVSISSDIIEEHDPIIATHMNGERLTLDNKGPYWVMFDFDSPAIKAIPEMRGLSIWALAEIEVE
jgi:hypothetical protein